MKKKACKKFICLSMLGIVFLYVSYHIYAFAFPDIKTETAYSTQVFEAIDAEAYIIRDEKNILTDLNGYLNFVLTDGDKVAKDGVVAHVYSSEEQGLLRKKVRNIECEIERLENLSNVGIALSISPSSIERQAYQELNTLIKCVNENEYQKLNKGRNKILYLLNERQLTTGQVFDFSDKIAQLKLDVDNLNAKNEKEIKTILADESGYFIGKTDGYENNFNYNDVFNITTEQVSNLLNGGPNCEKVYAKLISNSNWYAVCNVKQDDAIKLYVDQLVNLSMPLASTDKLKAKIVAINQADKNSMAAVVIQCNYIDKNTLSIRKEPMKINIEEYKGISINKDAIHEKRLSKTVMDENTDEEKTEEKIVKGVYVRNGKQLAFKEVNIVFSGDDYILCNLNPDKSKLFLGDTIKEYDEIVVKGRDLYDGKFIR